MIVVGFGSEYPVGFTQERSGGFELRIPGGFHQNMQLRLNLARCVYDDSYNNGRRMDPSGRDLSTRNLQKVKCRPVLCAVSLIRPQIP